MKRFSILAAVSALVLALTFMPVDSVAANYADGTHNVSYEMKEANNDNTSIADGYFQKPAKVTISGATATVQVTVSSADMVKSLSGPGGSMNVVSDSGDTRTYSFQMNASDLSSPVSMDMNIVVPDLPELPGGYDRDHIARAVFDVSGLPKAGAGEGDEEDGGEAVEDSDDKVGDKDADNPKTGDDSPILMYTILLIGAAVALVLVRKLRPANE